MKFDFPHYAIFFLAGAIMTGIISIIVWKRRPAPGALPFALFSLAMAVWSLAWTLEIGSPEIAAKILWAKVEYLGIVAIGVLWLAFTLDYSGYTWWRRPRNLLLLSVVPIITLCLVWTNDWHGWFWPAVYLTFNDLGEVVVFEHGLWFSVFAPYQYLIIIIGIGILWRFGLRKSHVYRKQIIALTFGTMCPIFSNIIYLLSRNLTGGLDFTPLSFTVSGIIYVLTIFRYHFLDVVPIARSALVESMPDGILVLNNATCIVDINPAAEKLIGVTKSSAVGRQFEKIWHKAQLITSNPDSEKHIELVSESAGSRAYYEVSSTPLYDQNRSAEGRLIVIRNITERKLTHQKLEALYDKERSLRGNLQEEIENRGKYTRALVHELKTPLTAILSSSELLESEIREGVLSSVVNNIRHASINLERRANELIDLACGEIGILKVEYEPVDISSLIREIVQDMNAIASRKNISLVSQISDNLLVQGDTSRLQQVVINLLDNAIKYSSESNILIKVSIQELDTVLIQVHDRGCGMDKEKLVNIFDPYRRKSTEGQKFGGLGIGLALSKIYIDAHKGKIWVESTPGVGTTVNFSIPLYQNINDTAVTAFCPVCK